MAGIAIGRRRSQRKIWNGKRIKSRRMSRSFVITKIEKLQRRIHRLTNMPADSCEHFAPLGFDAETCCEALDATGFLVVTRVLPQGPEMMRVLRDDDVRQLRKSSFSCRAKLYRTPKQSRSFRIVSPITQCQRGYLSGIAGLLRRDQTVCRAS